MYLTISYKKASPRIAFAVGIVGEVCEKKNITLHQNESMELTQLGNILVLSDAADAKKFCDKYSVAVDTSMLRREGFWLKNYEINGDAVLCVSAVDETGAMYGVLELAEQLKIFGSLTECKETCINPGLAFRAVKFNLPWSPYRSGPATEVHVATCQDLDFWQKFINMMAENRFNALTLWNVHPFTFMIRPKHFPQACPFSDKELETWKSFWQALFRMAKERGIETYIINWNIAVSPEFVRFYEGKAKNDTSPLVKEYTRECVTQLINEYDDLTGLGVTLADWMKDMTPVQRENWIEQTFVAGIKAAQRPVKFIHRSVLAGSPREMRRLIDKAALSNPVLVEIKFNWSHSYSTTRLALTHDYASGKTDESFWKPEPVNYKIVWMMRNEDFFILRWGDSDFIRRHIKDNKHSYVDGYFVGSEGFIPAADYTHQPHAHKDWQYAFEKQWLFYLLWGRLLYDPDVADSTFAGAFNYRYATSLGAEMLQAYKLASRMLLRLASFHAGTWDYTLYAEGFLAPVKRGGGKGNSAFISIDELINHPVLDPDYMTIPAYVRQQNNKEQIPENMISPLQLADASEEDSHELMKVLDFLKSDLPPVKGALECEVADLEAWIYLGLYFSNKLRAGVALEFFKQTKKPNEKKRALSLLEKAAYYWENLSKVTERHYQTAPYVNRDEFSWGMYRSEVAEDIKIADQYE